MNNFPRFTDMSPEIREARARIEAAVEVFRAYARGPQPDPETLLRMKAELETMINSCPPWINVGGLEPEERAAVMAFFNKHNHGITRTPNRRTAWTDVT